jgi:pimeloyl-ACP methyl ester carboxylesterase
MIGTRTDRRAAKPLARPLAAEDLTSAGIPIGVVALKLLRNNRRIAEMVQSIPESAGNRLVWLLAGLSIIAGCSAMARVREVPKWLDLPETPSLSQPAQSSTVAVGGTKIWYAVFGEQNSKTVTLLHGGGANSNYWGHLVRDLSGQYRVVVIDSRGHGRSTFGTRSLSYASMADDVIAVLDHLKIGRTAIVGWSDGANIGFNLTLKYPARISGLYAFAGNANPGGMQSPPPNSAFQAFAAQSAAEFKRLSPVPAEAGRINAALSMMWKTQPQLSKNDLQKIKVPTWIVHAERDEVIRETHAKEVAASISNAKFVLLKEVSHFALLQDVPQFNGSVQEFLQSLR